MKKIHTDSRMNEQIVGMLRRINTPTTLYAAQRIEELEQQLGRAAAWAVEQTVSPYPTVQSVEELSQKLQELEDMVTEMRMISQEAERL